MPDYGHHHRQLRKQYAYVVESGRARCWRCGEPVLRGQKWHLGHDDSGERIMGVEHVKCNVGAMSRLRAADARAYRDGEAADGAVHAGRRRAGDDEYGISDEQQTALTVHRRWVRSLGWEGPERFSRHWWRDDEVSPACPCESCRAQFPPCPCTDCRRRWPSEPAA